MKKTILLSLFLIFLSKNLISQVIFADSSQINTVFLPECGQSDTFTLYIRNATGDTIKGVVLTDTLPNDLVFSAFISNSAINSFSQNGNIIKFFLNDLIDNQIVKIRVIARLKCNVLNVQNSLRMGLRLDFTNSSSQILNIRGIELISKVSAPSLIVAPIVNNNNSAAVVGQTYIRKWKIFNNKSGSVIDTTRLKIVYQNGISFYGLKINGITVSPSIVGDTLNYHLIQQLRNINIFPSDTILVEETYLVDECINSSGTSKISIFYGCFNTPFCKESFNVASTQTQVTVPSIAIQNTWRYACKGSYDTLIIRIINTGLGVARNFNFDVNASYGDYYVLGGAPVNFFDSSSATFKFGNNSSYQKLNKTSAIHFGFNRSFWPVSNPARQLFFSIPNIQAKDTVYFRVLHYNACVDASICSVYDKSINTAFSYQNNCLNNTYTIPRTNIRHERSDGAFKIDGPTDIGVNDTARYNMQFAPNSNTGVRYDSKGFLMLEIKYSAGLKWVQNNSDLTLRRLSSSGTDAADSVFHNSSTRTIQVFYRYNATTINVFNTRSSYFIVPRFTLECPSGGSSGSVSISAFDKRETTCNTACLEPFACLVSYPITLHCPSPCPRGGISPISAVISRTTFGLPDNNQDGLPDVGSSTLDFSKIETNKVVALDTFVLKYKGTIVRGVQSPAQFTFGYGESNFSTIGYLVNAIRGEIKIKDSSSGNWFTVNNLTNTFTNSGNNRTFKWDFSNNLSGFPIGYIFDRGDSIEVNCYYVFNPQARNYGNDLTNNVSNNFYVSHYANPTSDTAKYRCDIFNSFIKTVTTYYTVYNPDNLVWNGCGSYIATYRAYLSIGECCSNYNGSIHFPYEYRSYGFWDSLRVQIPQGLTVDSANLYLSNGTKVGNANNIYRWSVSPVSGNSTSQLYNIGQYFVPKGGNIVPSRGGFYGHMRVYFKPSSKTPNATAFTRNSNYGYTNINTWANRVNYLNTDPSPGNASWSRINNYSSGTTIFNGPALDISNVGAVSKQHINNQVFWDFKIQNNSNISDAANAWIAVQSKSGLLIIDSIKEVTGGAKLVKVGHFYRVGNITKNAGNKTFRVYVNQNACNKDSITLYTGWNCDNYPTVFNASIFPVDSIKTYLTENFSNLNVQVLNGPTAPIGLCDTINFNIAVSQLQNIQLKSTFLDVQLPNLGVGISIVNSKSTIKYPSNQTESSISPVNMGNGVFRYYVSDSNHLIKSRGLLEYDSFPKNAYQIALKCITNCDFVSGSEVRFIGQGTNFCSQLVSPGVGSNIINILGAPNRKLHFSTSVLPEIKPCNQNVDLSLKIRNLQNSVSNGNDNLYITLPSGVLYQNNSVVFSRNPFSDVVPSVSMIGDRQVLTWVADDIPSMDSALLKISVYSPANIPCGSNPYLEVETRSRYTASCQSNTCISQVQNSLEKTLTVIKKPNISFINGNANLLQDTTLGNISYQDTLNVQSLLFTNNGNDTGHLYLTFFHDANSNNRFDSSESVFHVDSINNFYQGTNRDYTKILTYPHRFLPDTVKIFGSVHCNCNQTNFLVSPEFIYTPLEDETIVLNGSLKGNVTQLWFAGLPSARMYILERRSIEETDFTTIGSFEPNFNNVYSFNDLINLSSCKNYVYRVRAIGYNGNLIFSNSVEIITCQNQSVKMYPNPVSNGLVTLAFAQTIKGKMQFLLTNSLGQTVEILPQHTNNQMMVFNLNHFQSGFYELSVINSNGKVEHLKLIINQQ